MRSTKVRSDRLRHGLRDGLQPCQQAYVSEGRVGAVQQAQLRALVCRDVTAHRDADGCPVGLRGAVYLLHDPLHEPLALDRPRILETGCLRHPLPQRLVGGGSNAVDHRARKARRLLDPGGEARIASRREGQHRAPQRGTVTRQVVAGNDEIGREPARAPQLQAVRQPADEAARRLGMAQVVSDVRMREVEPAGSVEAVAFLRHRHGDYRGVRIAEAAAHGHGALACDQQLANGADDAQGGRLV